MTERPWGTPRTESAGGFWAQATADPDRLILIAPDGEKWTAGRLHAAANQLVHAL